MPSASADAFVKINFIADTKRAVASFSQLHPHLARFGRVAATAGKIAAAGIAVAIAAFVALGLALRSALAKYDEYFTGILKLQRVTGMSAKSASTLTGQLRLSGVEASKASTAFGILSVKIYDARQGYLANAAAAKEALKAGKDFVPVLNTQQKLFKDLGVKLTDDKGKFREIGDVIGEVRDKISKLDDRTKQVALAKKLLGRGGSELLPWLLKTNKEIAELTQKLRDMGMIKGEGAMKVFRQYKKNARELSLAWDAIRINAAQALAPLINKYLPMVSDGIKRAAKWLNRFAIMAQNKGIAEAANKMIPGIRQVGEWWQRNRKDIIGAGRALVSTAKWTKANIGPAIQVSRWFAKWVAPIGVAIRMAKALYSAVQSVIGPVRLVASALRSWSTAGLNSVLGAIRAIISAAQTAYGWIQKVLQGQGGVKPGYTTGRKGGGPGRHPATGGIATGPMSGYSATLHGTELVIPLNGNKFTPGARYDYGSATAAAGGTGSGQTINVNVIVPGGTTLIGTAQEVGNILAPHVARAIGREYARAGRRR